MFLAPCSEFALFPPEDDNMSELESNTPYLYVYVDISGTCLKNKFIQHAKVDEKIEEKSGQKMLENVSLREGYTANPCELGVTPNLG